MLGSGVGEEGWVESWGMKLILTIKIVEVFLFYKKATQ